MDKQISATFSTRSTITLTADSLITDHYEEEPKEDQADVGRKEDNIGCRKTATMDSVEVHRHGSRKCTCRYLWNTELHGLTAFLKSRTLAERIVWGTIITVCLLMSVFTTEWMFDDYLDRQTATLITIEQRQRGGGNRGLKFPVIVLCPKNPDSLKFHLILRDIAKRLPRLDRVTIRQLISFAVAGAGFSNVGQFMARRRIIMPKLSDLEIQRLSALFRRWRGRRSISEFYKNLFEDWGYRCSEFLRKCYYGYQEIPCCDIFTPYYVMLRGRCLRLNRSLYQIDPADVGRIDIYMNQMSSRLTEATGMQPQVIAYLTDNFPNVGTFPRYYVHFRSAVLLRARARNISMLPWNSQCRNIPQEMDPIPTAEFASSRHFQFFDRNSCWLNRWLREKVNDPYNCTLFYLDFGNYTVCDPATIVKNYQSVVDLRLSNDTSKRCLPACQRSEHLFQEFRPKASILNKRNNVPPFRLEVSFTNLEMEVYQEVVTTTLPGFVSQLGGQSGLFVGLSVCSLVQIFISAAWKCHRLVNAYLGERRRSRRMANSSPIRG